MNILFANYGDFTTSSLNHIAGYANRLCGLGHACAVAVPKRKDTILVVPDPLFIPATFQEVLARPNLFPNGAPADIIHAWTPREVVRRFLLEHQRRAPSRLLVHLEDNEEFLLEAFSGRPIAELRELDEGALQKVLADALASPLRHRNLLRVCDAVTYIVANLARFAPPQVPSHLLPPGVDLSLYRPQGADPGLRSELGLRDGEKVIVFTGSNTFANEPDLRALHVAVKLLNDRGIPTRLVRTGFSSDSFRASLGPDCAKWTIDLGFVGKARLPKLLALADALVQPGRPDTFNEGRLPSKLPEFLAMGKPVILPAANIGALMKDGEDALLLRTGTPDEIADACARVFSDPALAARLSQGALAFARGHFDLVAVTARLESIYAAAAGRPIHPRWTRTRAEGTTETTLVAEALAETLAADPGEPSAAAADLAMLTGQLEAAAAATREQLRIAEAGLALSRAKFATSEEAFRLTRQHAANLENLRRRLSRRVRELDAQCAHLTRTIGARDETIRQRDGRILALKATFSWRSTAFLRFLRRKLIDPRRPKRGLAAAPAPEPPPAAGAAEDAEEDSPFAHSVDFPQRWSFKPRTVPLRGWCFAEDGRKLTAIRAALPGRVVPGTYGLKRLDVFTFVGYKPQAEYCGWRIDLPLVPADTRLDLEVQDAPGAWHPFFEAVLRVGEDCAPPDLTSYEEWICAHDDPKPGDLRRQAEAAAALPRKPLISIVMPVFNTPEAYLMKAVESVRAQTYPHWELCIADDASPEPHVRRILEEYLREEPRVKVVFRPGNGHISAASNSALELATGEYVALLDHDDALAPNALYEVALAINANPDAGFIYSDEDKIDGDDRRFEPYFKPDFLPDLFLAQNYTTHLSVYRTDLVAAAGGFRTGYEGSQDWDLALRICERIDAARIRHIPRILYHWRAVSGSTALMLCEKSYPIEAARRTLAEHFQRIGRSVELVPVPGGHWRAKYPLPDPAPLVSLIIPTRNGLELLEALRREHPREDDLPEFRDHHRRQRLRRSSNPRLSREPGGGGSRPRHPGAERHRPGVRQVVQFLGDEQQGRARGPRGRHRPREQRSRGDRSGMARRDGGAGSPPRDRLRRRHALLPERHDPARRIHPGPGRRGGPCVPQLPQGNGGQVQPRPAGPELLGGHGRVPRRAQERLRAGRRPRCGRSRGGLQRRGLLPEGARGRVPEPLDAVRRAVPPRERQPRRRQHAGQGRPLPPRGGAHADPMGAPAPIRPGIQSEPHPDAA